MLDFSIAQNVTLPILPRLFPRLLVRRATERSVADEHTEQLNVRMTGVDQEVGALSGGNQQKVVLAKWLAIGPAGPDPRRAHPRHRHRGQGRGPPDHRGARGVGPRRSSSSRATCPRSWPCPTGSSSSTRAGSPPRSPASEATQERVMFAATGSLHAATDAPRPPSAARRPMAEPVGRAPGRPGQRAGSWPIGRQRELTLLAIMFVLGAGVSLLAPQFLTVDNFSQVAVARLDHRDRRRRRGDRRSSPAASTCRSRP